jgi:PPM family protein phosphatase
LALRIVEEAGLTDVGRQRSTNEDSLLEAAPVFAVADGMGGARAGEVASRVAVEMLSADAGGEDPPEERLARVARAANRRIYELAQDDESRSGMGTTLTAVIVDDGQIATGHVGDSRLYRFRDDRLERLTRDHSLVEELVRRGELDPDEVESHPQRSIITRALGPAPEVEVETFTAPGREDDVYLLCSDGLTTMVKEDRVAEIIRTRSSLVDAAERLVNSANEAGGRDNVTVVLFRLGEVEGEGDDDTAGQDTRADLKVEDVREAAAATRAHAPPPTREAPLEVPVPRPPARPRRRGRAAVTAFLVLLSIAILVAGFWFGTRQFYYLGTDDQGVITISRGVPVELPGGITLSTPVATSRVQAQSLPSRQRQAVLSQKLRSREDAEDLFRTLEQQEAGANLGGAASEGARRKGASAGGQGRPRAGGQGGSASGGGSG